MSTEEKPLSELISSIEQQGFTPTEEMKTGDVTPPKEKSSKAFIIIVSILLLLIVGIGGYYIYTNYIVKEEETVEEEDTMIEDDNEEENTLCSNLENQYDFNSDIGSVSEEYVGSWHACGSVGSGYCDRFIFFNSGNYVFFPNQMECDINDELCESSPIERGIWELENDKINVAIQGDMNNLRSISVTEVINTSEEIYPIQTTFDGNTYWLFSKETNIWDSETGEGCF